MSTHVYTFTSIKACDAMLKNLSRQRFAGKRFKFTPDGSKELTLSDKSEDLEIRASIEMRGFIRGFLKNQRNRK
jgi:hypothetical protein